MASFSRRDLLFLIAVALTPFLYLLHHAIDRYLGKTEADRLIEQAAQGSVRPDGVSTSQG